MKTADNLLYIENNQGIIPISDLPYSMSESDSLIISFFDETESYLVMETRSSFQEAQSKLERRTGKPWIRTDKVTGHGEKVYNPDCIDIKRTIASNMDIRGSIRVIVMHNPKKPDYNISDVISDNEYKQLMQALNVEKPWWSDPDAKNLPDWFPRDIVLTPDGVYVSHFFSRYNRETDMIRDPLTEDYKPITRFTDKMILSTMHTIMELNDLLRVWDKLGIKYKKQRVTVDRKAYVAYIANGLKFKDVCKSLAEEEKLNAMAKES